jgi:hypothetical protein
MFFGKRNCLVLVHHVCFVCLTVFYYVGLYFCLRDEEEQYTCTLVPEQFRRKPSDISVYSEDVSYLYHELISKNNQHRYKDINSKAKELKLMWTKFRPVSRKTFRFVSKSSSKKSCCISSTTAR